MTTNILRIGIENMSDLHNKIPKDGNKHKVIVIDRDKKHIYYVKNTTHLSYYIKTAIGTLEPLPFNAKFENEVMHKVQSKEYQDFRHVTIEFLKSLSVDFGDLRDLLDMDMKLGEIKINNEKKSYSFSIPRWNIDPNPKMKSRIIKGFMQSKKTWIIIATAMYYYLLYRVPVFIVIENKLSACDQITERIRDIFSKYMEHIGKRDMKDNFESLFKILDVNRGKKVSSEQFRDAMTGKRPRIFISLRSEYDLGPVNTILSKFKKKRYALIMDESDAIDNMSSSAAQEELDKLKQNASVIWNVTATAMTSLMKEDIESGNVFVMRKPENYKDLPIFNMYRLGEDSQYSDNVGDDPFQKDKNLKRYISDFSNKNPYEVPIWGGIKHPVITLIRVCTTIEPQIKVVNYIQNNYAKKIVSITYNGSGYGITLRGDNLPTIPITIKSIVSDYTDSTHIFASCSIGDILSYLQNNGGVERYPRISILAGKMADRGITFGSSNYSECLRKNTLPWHLTEMYYLAAVGTDQPNLLQAAGRLCGVYVDNIPLTLYSNACEDIVKAYHAQEELIQRSREKCTENLFMRDIIPTVEISKEKCSKRRFTTPKVNCRIRKVPDDEEFGGWDWKKEERICNIPDYIVRASINETKTDTNNEDGMKYIVKSYRNKSTSIYKIIQEYIKRDFEALSASELKKGLGNDKLHMPNFDRWNLKHNQYKLLVKVPNKNKYTLCPKVVEALELFDN